MAYSTRASVPILLLTVLAAGGCGGDDDGGVSQADEDSARQACEFALENMYDLDLVEFDYTEASAPEQDAVELTVTVTGPEGSEDVVCVARQDGSLWSVDLDEVEVQG